MALVASTAEAAQAAEAMLRRRFQFVPLEEAELIVALGGDGFILHTLHEMLGRGRVCPVFGMNRGTVGFLMNEWRLDGLVGRLAAGEGLLGRAARNDRDDRFRRDVQPSRDQRGLAA